MSSVDGVRLKAFSFDMRLQALLLLLFLRSSCEMSTLRPDMEESKITKYSMEEDQGSGILLEHLAEMYWSGTAPLCFGGCMGHHKELKRDTCGNSSCCWVGYKSLCRVNCGPPDVDFTGMVYGNDWWIGSVVHHECRPGFILVGNAIRTCQANGKWTAKPSCLRVCLQGQVAINEKDIDKSCTSNCLLKSLSYSASLKHGCSLIKNCRIKDAGWNRWFTRCTTCECDCFIPCASAG